MRSLNYYQPEKMAKIGQTARKATTLRLRPSSPIKAKWGPSSRHPPFSLGTSHSNQGTQSVTRYSKTRSRRVLAALTALWQGLAMACRHDLAYWCIDHSITLALASRHAGSIEHRLTRWQVDNDALDCCQACVDGLCWAIDIPLACLTICRCIDCCGVLWGLWRGRRESKSPASYD